MPPGAEVIIHGRSQGQQSPATYTGLFPGTITVQVRKDGKGHTLRFEIDGTPVDTLQLLIIEFGRERKPVQLDFGGGPGRMDVLEGLTRESNA